jgi:hypothetical protein
VSCGDQARIIEEAASRCGSVVTLAQVGHELVNDGVVLRRAEGELMYARRDERLFRGCA